MNYQVNYNPFDEIMQLINENGIEGMPKAMEIIINEAMKIERSEALSAKPYERSSQRTGYANGFKDKKLNARCGRLELKIPQVRSSKEPFYPSALEKGTRSERSLSLALAQMYVQGVSTRKVSKIIEEMCGFEVSSTQVSGAAKKLDEELEKWRNRNLGQVKYLVLDARYEKVRTDGSVMETALFVAVGVFENGQRGVVGVSVGRSEAEVHWREFLDSLIKRGMRGVEFIVSDNHPGLKAARKATLQGVPWQRCQMHLQQNAQAHIRKNENKIKVAEDIRNIFNCIDRKNAEQLLKETALKWSEKESRLADWMENNIPEGFSVFSLKGSSRQKKLRTTNGIERLNKEIKRRTKVVGIFPNDDSLLRLASAVLMEKSEEWETGKKYIKPDNDT